MAKNIIDFCGICGLEKKMTFEHYPPESAGNTAAIKIQDYRHLTPLGGHLKGKSMRSNNGFGGYRLCKECNNNSGSWYANDYANVANEALPKLRSQKNSDYFFVKQKLKPLNFLKQAIVMLQCADHGAGTIRTITNQTNFILDKYSRELSDEIQIYMYSTLSTTHRNLGVMTFSSGVNMGIVNYAEFNFYPFGFLLSLDSKPPKQNMKNITPYKYFNYDLEIIDDFKLPILNVKGMLPGEYIKTAENKR